jgi:hypothetical protein
MKEMQLFRGSSRGKRRPILKGMHLMEGESAGWMEEDN